MSFHLFDFHFKYFQWFVNNDVFSHWKALAKLQILLFPHRYYLQFLCYFFFFVSLINRFNTEYFGRNIDYFTLLACHVKSMRLPCGLWAIGHDMKRERCSGSAGDGTPQAQPLLTCKACCHHMHGFSTFISSCLGLSNNLLANNPLHVAFTFETRAAATTSETEGWICIWAGTVAATKCPGPFLMSNNKLA